MRGDPDHAGNPHYQSAERLRCCGVSRCQRTNAAGAVRPAAADARCGRSVRSRWWATPSHGSCWRDLRRWDVGSWSWRWPVARRHRSSGFRTRPRGRWRPVRVPRSRRPTTVAPVGTAGPAGRRAVISHERFGVFDAPASPVRRGRRPGGGRRWSTGYASGPFSRTYQVRRGAPVAAAAPG